MTRELSFASKELQRDSNEIQDGQGALLTFSQVVDCSIVVAVNVSHWNSNKSSDMYFLLREREREHGSRKSCCGGFCQGTVDQLILGSLEFLSEIGLVMPIVYLFCFSLVQIRFCEMEISKSVKFYAERVCSSCVVVCFLHDRCSIGINFKWWWRWRRRQRVCCSYTLYIPIFLLDLQILFRVSLNNWYKKEGTAAVQRLLLLLSFCVIRSCLLVEGDMGYGGEEVHLFASTVHVQLHELCSSQ